MALERTTSQERSRTPEKAERPKPTFHGMLVSPESIGILPNGKKAIATFNAALIEVPNSRTGEPELLSVFRVQTDEHKKDRADGTNFFGMQRVSITSDGLTISEPKFVSGRSLLAPEDIGKNPEDMRLSYDSVTHQVYGALTETMEMSYATRYQEKKVPIPPGKENEVTDNPTVATVVGRPVFNGETGSIEAVVFDRTQFVFEAIDGEERPRMLVGKNAWVEYTHDGGKILRYRPEFIEGKVNKTHIRTLFYGGDGLWHRVKEYSEEGAYPTDTTDQLMPQGNTFERFGLNGRTLIWKNKAFRIDHIVSASPPDADGKQTVEYGFMTVDDTMKPLLSYNEAVALSGQKPNDLTGDKKVIYCNGYEIVGNRLVMAVTLFDRSIGIFSYDMDELSQYATDIKSNLLSEVFPLHRNERRSVNLG